MPATGKAMTIAPGIHWVGVEDWHRRSFDTLMGLPYGTSYNSYLVVGKEKIALIDTVHKNFTEEFLDKIRLIVDPARIDYLVMNHAEPDHGGSLPTMLSLAPHAKVLATEKGTEMARIFHQVPAERSVAVSEADTIDLGGKTLKFVSAPWLHWPETMFTYSVEDGVLFPCDFFAAHVASDLLFADEVGHIVLPEAKVYYAVIMMPYAKMAASGLDKAIALEPRTIAPSHGPVWRQSQPILEAYKQWIRAPLAKKAIVPFATMWHSTQRLAEAVTGALSAEGIETIPYDLSVTDTSQLAKDLVDTSAIALGSPTVVGGLHPLASNALFMVRMLRPRARIGAYFGSYGWGGGAAAQAKAALEAIKMEIVDSLDIKGPPLEKDLDRAAALGRNVARKILDSTNQP